MHCPLVLSDSIAGCAYAVAPPFACSTSDGGHSAAWVHLAGELDIATTLQLDGTLREHRSQVPLVVLDLRDLTFWTAAACMRSPTPAFALGASATGWWSCDVPRPGRRGRGHRDLDDGSLIDPRSLRVLLDSVRPDPRGRTRWAMQ